MDTMKYIKQHYRNGRNWGDTWWFITKMMLKGNLLTDAKYQNHLAEIFREVGKKLEPLEGGE